MKKRASALESAASHASRNLAAQMEKKSNLTRFSGRALQVRLSALFPAQFAANPDRDYFSNELAVGADRAIAQLNRPVNALEQVGLKGNVTRLCANEVVPASYGSAPRSSIYSDQVWLSTETTRPTDEALLAATLVARNVWLDPLPLTSLEITELSRLYTAVYGTVDGSESQSPTAKRQRSHQAICIAALSAPQFSMGLQTVNDPLRRMMIEIGSRVPLISELENFQGKKKSILEFLNELQKNSASGYYTAIHQWHEDWFGLRRFLPENGPTWDPRGSAYFSPSDFFAVGYTATPDSNPAKLPLTVPYRDSAQYPGVGQAYIPYTCDPNIDEDFDPRTTMIIFERQTGPNWEVTGAFVHKQKVTNSQGPQSYQSVLSAYGVLDFNPAVDCMDFDHAPVLPVVNGALQNDPEHNNDSRFAIEEPNYLRCRGRITDPGGSGSLVPSRMQDFYRTVADHPLRMRRISPSGEQHGVSRVKTWYTQQDRRVCNSMPRYFTTCALRARGNYGGNGDAWDFYEIPGNGYFSHNSWWFSTSLAHPGILNQFRCGIPDMNAISRSDGPLTLQTDLIAYPHGYDRSKYLAPFDAQNPVNLNELITAGYSVAEVGKEGDAIKRLRKDLKTEPYQLIDHVVFNNRSYREVFTADYLVGHEELELFYRAQGMLTPVYPPGMSAPDSSLDRTITTPSIMPLNRFQSMSSNLYASGPSSYFLNYAFNMIYFQKPITMIPRRPAAGVLAMPAFLTPVGGNGGKMRTIASRYFARLLCGDPGAFVPTPAEKVVHVRHMLDAANPETSRTAADHLDPTKGCIACHVNLDPLGASLSPQFLGNVQVNEGAAIQGEMAFTPVGLGAGWGAYKGTGAFLGEEVTGVEGVARKLVTSDIWAKCVVQKTFENVFGRVVNLPAEKETFDGWTRKFQTQGQNYNQLVRDMVGSSLYQGVN
ncbi:MAG: hypothetical protein H7222_11810 [Methylotenera sp.]|nr:hypothetical protein [Oligoflexia bacterium]